MVLGWLYEIGPLGTAGADSWALGWESVLALVTLLLAGVTTWLVWTTRRLARSTAEEVQGQIRPVVVPVGDTVEATRNEHAGDSYFDVAINVHNIGAGPALNFNFVIGEGS